MFLTLKKNPIIIVVVVVIVVIAICGCVGAVCYSHMVLPAALPIYEHTIVIDAGHGGIDGGVVGSQGIKESDINLKMAFILQKELEGRNFGVVMTRTTKDALNNIKRLDMQARKNIIIKSSPTAVISLHVNRFSDSSRRGAQVFYDDTGIGKDFASAMQSHINKNINAKYGDRSNYEALGGDLFITKCVKVPSIIIECGFISNPYDEKLLLSEDYCKDLCKRIGEVVSASVVG